MLIQERQLREKRTNMVREIKNKFPLINKNQTLIMFLLPILKEFRTKIKARLSSNSNRMKEFTNNSKTILRKN